MRFYTLVILLAFMLSVTLATPAHAYLDPGTGSMIFQGIIAIVVTVAATGSIYWRRIKSFFSKSKDDK